MEPPPRGPRDAFVAHQTESSLLIPEIAEHTRTPERFQQVSPFTFLEVGFISRIVRVSFAFDLNVSFDGRTSGALQPDLTQLPIAFVRFAEEAPDLTTTGLKVSRFEPTWTFIRMSSTCPPPQSKEDDGVDASECTLAHDVPVIVSPAPDLWVEFADQIGRRCLKPGSNRSPNPVQEGLDVLPGWFDEQFPVRVPAHVLSEEVEPVCHVRDDRLLWREFKPSFSQELLDEWPNLFYQQVFRSAGDDEVIRVTDEIHSGIQASEGLDAFSRWVLFLQDSLEPIQREIG